MALPLSKKQNNRITSASITIIELITLLLGALSAGDGSHSACIAVSAPCLSVCPRVSTGYTSHCQCVGNGLTGVSIHKHLKLLNVSKDFLFTVCICGLI